MALRNPASSEGKKAVVDGQARREYKSENYGSKWAEKNAPKATPRTRPADPPASAQAEPATAPAPVIDRNRPITLTIDGELGEYLPHHLNDVEAPTAEEQEALAVC